MKRISTLICMALACIMTLAACGAEKSVDSAYFAADNASALAGDIESYLTKCDFNGAVLIAADGKPVYASGFGTADVKTGAECTALDTFEIGSLSKQFTAAAILMLCEKGSMSLDDTLDRYIPELTCGSNITIRNLLNMRSGLYDYINDAHTFFPEDFVDEYLARADADNDSEPDFDREFLLEYINDAPIRTEPNSDFYYCNTDYYLLGLVIERVSGMSYQQFLSENIFAPCGMLTANNDFMNTTARGYFSDGSTLSMRTSTALGCGSVNASVYDLYKWFTALYGGKLISEESLDEMTANVGGYGFGVICSNSMWYHGGSTDVFNSYAAYYPNDSLLVIVLANSPIEETSATYIGKNLWELYRSNIAA